jgi:AcrR family transcriptional regulator
MRRRRQPKRRSVLPAAAAAPSSQTENPRRTEILDAAAELFGSSGFHVTLEQIAESCGILAGSLYHHFESKEAIVIELVERYRAELDQIAARATADLEGASKPIFDRIVALAEAIVACAIRHRAALLQTFYDPPANASARLVQLAKRTPGAIDEAMLSLLRAGRIEGYIRPGIDLPLLAEQLCQSMLHTGVGFFHRTPGAHQVPAIKCRMLLEGLAADTPDSAKLERSSAFAAATLMVASWGHEDKDGQAGLLQAVARTEFGRRGYEATTVRDIASAAGMSTGTVYRLIGSKDALLTAIMSAYIKDVDRSWDAILTSKATSVEKLYALLWLDINVLERFSDEFKIQLAWLRQSPPTSDHFSSFLAFTKQLRHLRTLLGEGERLGDFHTLGASETIRAHCLFELTWMSENIVRRGGTRAALALARDTILNGAAKRDRAGAQGSRSSAQA